MLCTEYLKLRECVAVLPDAELTELAMHARMLFASRPPLERDPPLSRVTDLLITELWERYQQRLARWRYKNQPRPLQLISFAELTEALRTPTDSVKVLELSAAVDHKSIVQARNEARRVLSSLAGVDVAASLKGEPWSGQDG